MSQKKVDAYKEYKKNKAEVLKKEKRQQNIEKGVIGVILALFVVWFGFSAYQSATRPDEADTAAVEATELFMDDYSAYVNGLNLFYS